MALKRLLFRQERAPPAIIGNSAVVALVFILFSSVANSQTSNPSARINRTAYHWSELNHYELLNLSKSTEGRQTHLPPDRRSEERENVRREDVKSAYYAQAKRHHPDKAPSSHVKEKTARMARIIGAYEVLYNAPKKNATIGVCFKRS
mmetsp:Transcript_26371/g.77973  ORF Transcript_26371/g.77973 Transcript_26371/m.77973 type:complete len:148 (-) Transcript_26371:413-856(-)